MEVMNIKRASLASDSSAFKTKGMVECCPIPAAPAHVTVRRRHQASPSRRRCSKLLEACIREDNGLKRLPHPPAQMTNSCRTDNGDEPRDITAATCSMLLSCSAWSLWVPGGDSVVLLLHCGIFTHLSPRHSSAAVCPLCRATLLLPCRLRVPVSRSVRWSGRGGTGGVVLPRLAGGGDRREGGRSGGR